MNIMMQLGSYQFQLSTAAYQEFQRSSAWTWAEQKRFGQDDALQFTGRGEDTITLPGVIFPEFRGGLGQIDAMRAEADIGILLPLIDGLGNMLGDWAITQVDERDTVFIANGVPLKMEFTIKLRRGPLQLGQGLLAAITPVLAQAAGSDTVAAAKNLAATASNAPDSLLAGLQGSMATIGGLAGAIGGATSGILSAVRSGMKAATLLKNAGGDATNLLKNIKSPAGVASAMNGLVNISGGVSRSAGVAGSFLKAAGVDLAATAIEPLALQAVRDAMINVNKVTVLAVSVRTEGDVIVKQIASDEAMAAAEAGFESGGGGA